METQDEFIKLFLHAGLRVQGSAHEPLFCASDVERHIGDTHLARALKGADERYVRTLKAPDKRGRERKMSYFTERGLYRYLLQSHRKEAEAFQERVYDILEAERRRVVSAAQLEAKISRDAAAAAFAEVKRVRKALHEAREPQPPAAAEGFGAFAEHCYRHWLWAQGEEPDSALGLLLPEALPLEEGARAALEELWLEGRDAEALERFGRLFGPADLRRASRRVARTLGRPAQPEGPAAPAAPESPAAAQPPRRPSPAPPARARRGGRRPKPAAARPA